MFLATIWRQRQQRLQIRDEYKRSPQQGRRALSSCCISVVPSLITKSLYNSRKTEINARRLYIHTSNSSHTSKYECRACRERSELYGRSQIDALEMPQLFTEDLSANTALCGGRIQDELISFQALSSSFKSYFPATVLVSGVERFPFTNQTRPHSFNFLQPKHSGHSRRGGRNRTVWLRCFHPLRELFWWPFVVVDKRVFWDNMS